MIKLIATDMDDTLLGTNRNISPYTLDVLDRVREKGIVFTICTGRMFDSVRVYLDALKLTHPVIVYNGAMVVDPCTGEQLYHRPVETPLALEVLALAAQWGCHAQIYKNDQLFTQQINEETRIYQQHTGTMAIATHKPLTECLEVPTTKIILIMDKALVEKRLPEARALFAGRLEITVSKPEYLEFMDPSVNKGKTLDYLAQSMGILPSEVLAFGDAKNDLPMLEYAGCAVAVANAVEEAKAVASKVCGSCDQDGVARYIEEFIL